MAIKVSIIEDDDWIRENLATEINRTTGFTCSGKHQNAEDAINRINRESPDVVLLDINLPRMNGIECARKLKALVPSAQILMLTVYEDSEKIFKSLLAGASGYLLKRTPRDELLSAIRQVHEGGSPMTSYIARKVVQSFYQSPAERSETEGLSPREREVLELLARGYFYKEITEALGISMSTVNTHVRRIYEKLHVHSRAQAVAKLAEMPTRR